MFKNDKSNKQICIDNVNNSLACFIKKLKCLQAFKNETIFSYLNPFVGVCSFLQKLVEDFDSFKIVKSH